MPPSSPGPVPSAPADARPPAGANVEPASPLVSTALGLIGVPYLNGGSGPSGFDCSGFVQYVFARHGWRLPREVREQYLAGSVVALGDVIAGDLVFFETVSRGASHVGIAVGGNRFVHAPSARGVVRVETYSSAYWSTRFVGARRVMTLGSTELSLADHLP